MKFAAVFEYCADKAKILEARPLHREYLAGILKDGHLVLGGPFTDDSGAIIIYEAGSADEAEGLIKADPFATRGVFVKWTVRPWKLVMAGEVAPG
ncbi:MAG TPA: YciI family protein [Bryobacteraceae bacterium]|jgi:hypothetical protein